MEKLSAQVLIEDCDIVLQFNHCNGEELVYAKHSKYETYYLGFRADNTVPYSMIEQSKELNIKRFNKAVKHISEGHIKLSKV